jgi:peptide/nickel transport system permease protein
VSRLVSLIGVAMPNFWMGYLLMILFGVMLKVLPTSGFGEGGDLEHMILPAITLGAAYAAYSMRLLRSGMIEALGQEYVKAARAKGLKERVVIIRHALRNALIPFVTFAGLNMGYLLNGSMIVETIFAWPGIGNLFVSSIYLKDYPMVQGCILVIALIYVAVNLAVDISYLFIDPRIRYAAAN